MSAYDHRPPADPRVAADPRGAGVGAVLPGEGGWRVRFFLRLTVIVALGSTLLHGIFFVLFRKPIEGDYGSVFYTLRHLAEFLLPLLSFLILAYTLLICAATAVLCVYALHKVAGPLYRMERVVDEFAGTGPVRAIFFRKGDGGGKMAEAFNTFMDVLRKDRDACLELVESARSAKGVSEEEKDRAVRSALAEAAGILSRYR